MPNLLRRALTGIHKQKEKRLHQKHSMMQLEFLSNQINERSRMVEEALKRGDREKARQLSGEGVGLCRELYSVSESLLSGTGYSYSSGRDMLAHKLFGPTRGALGYFEIIHEGKHHEQDIGRLRGCAGKLVHNVSIFNSEPLRTKVDVKSMLSKYDHPVPEGVKLHKELNAGFEARVDARVLSALDLLVENAVQLGARNITIRTEVVPSGVDSWASFGKIIVENDRTFVPNELRERIFKGISTREDGHGLGLQHAQQIFEENRARIVVESEKGEKEEDHRTRFIISFKINGK